MVSAFLRQMNLTISISYFVENGNQLNWSFAVRTQTNCRLSTGESKLATSGLLRTSVNRQTNLNEPVNPEASLHLFVIQKIGPPEISIRFKNTCIHRP